MQPNLSETPAYWAHKIKAYPDPVAVTRLAQLIDFDDRLYEAARITYRFLINWYHRDHGDALLSMRHVSKVMKGRTPQSAAVLSHSAVRRAIIALMETGWVVRTVKGRGKGKTASRYVPTLNVLDMAALGKFPELLRCNETVAGEPELVHINGAVGPKLLHHTEAVEPQLVRANGTKTHLLDPRTLDSQGSSKGTVSAAPTAPPAAALEGAAAGSAGFQQIWQAYGKLGNKAAAKEAFAAVANPDVDHIVSRAAAWAASARPGQKRMPLEKWLAAEKYDEADRKVDPKPMAANDNVASKKVKEEEVKPSRSIPEPPRRIATRTDTIASVALEHRNGDAEIVVRLSGGHHRRFAIESASEKAQRAGQVELGQLGDIRGASIEDVSDLVGLSVRLVEFEDGSAEWRSAA